MVEIDAMTSLVGPDRQVTLLDAFEGRTQLIAYYFMWHTGHSAAWQCEGCPVVAYRSRSIRRPHTEIRKGDRT